MLFWESSAWKISEEKSMTRVNVRLYYRRSLRSCSVKKKTVHKNSAKFTGKHLCRNLFFNITTGTSLKKRLWHKCFPVNFEKFFRSLFHRTPSGNCSYYYIRGCWLTIPEVFYKYLLFESLFVWVSLRWVAVYDSTTKYLFEKVSWYFMFLVI